MGRSNRARESGAAYVKILWQLARALLNAAADFLMVDARS